MALPPPFTAAQQILQPDDPLNSGFKADIAPSVSGFGTRQSRLKNERAGFSTRKMMYWLIPEGPIVQFYINPQNVVQSHKKAISQQRTKGGFVIQYWGEELTTLRLSGTTGTSGIEGINVLYDVYRNEQLALDPYALFLAAQSDEALINGGAIGSTIGGLLGGGEAGNIIGGVVGGLLEAGSATASPNPTRPKPSLAALACAVELYWSGEVFRGFFTDFDVTESADRLGMFNYNIGFTVTQKRGFRTNFLPWHRAATSGPSNSDPRFGTPHSYGSLVDGETATPQREPSSNSSLSQNLQDSSDSLTDIF
jgi:hypothetical protein